MESRSITFVLIAIAALGSGCDAIDQALDCNDICSRYADCHDVDYDIDECASQCRDRADADRDYADAASACETCLDDRSCDGSSVCVDECQGVLP
jgi:hypothetical protein